MWFDENPEWRNTIIVIALCVVINSSLPIWLRLANIFDDRNYFLRAGTHEDSEADSEHNEEDNNPKGGSNRNDALSVVSDAQYSIVSSAIGSQIDAVLEARPRKTARADRNKRRKRERDIRFAVGMRNLKVDEKFDRFEIVPLPKNGNISFDGTKSVMSKISGDHVSINDGVNDKGVETQFQTIDSPYKRRSCCQVVLEVTEWDYSLASIAGFYMAQSFTEKVFAIVEIAVISQVIGTTEANAYIMVGFMFEITGIFVAGFVEAIGVLVPQADGSGNDLMVGRYLQIGIAFTIIFEIPGFVLWSLYMYDTVIWFGFDEVTATIAQNYTYSILFSSVAEDVDDCLKEFFDVIDHEKYVTLYSVISECIRTGVLVAMAYSGVTDMVAIGWAQTAVALTLLFGNLVIVVNNGWLDDYLGGLVKSCGLKDWRAMRTTFVTAVPLAIAWLLSIGEWQVMAIFAQSLGPDKVIVWNLLGYVWELFEALIEAITDAAEVRVGFRMGAGKPQEARKMSEKSIYFGTQLAIITAGGIFVVAEYVLPWITPNRLYQKLIFDQIPLIGFGGIIMVPGLVIEGILCAQGRVRLMTAIEIFVSWFIAIPIAAVLVYCFDSNLDGIVAGLVVGYSTGATILLFYFLRSNWEQLSKMVIKQNAAEGLKYLDTDWDELPQEVQEAASTLGYTQIMWESNREPSSTNKSWKYLTEAERTAASVLGYNKKKWNGESNSIDDSVNYEEYDFDDLPKDVKEAAKFLGFTRSIWNKDGKIPIESKDWVDLTSAQQKAASTLGYTKEKWDNDSDSSSSSSSSVNTEIQAMEALPAMALTPAIPEEKVVSTSVIREEKMVDYNDYDFKELPSEVKKAAKFLGYTSSVWDHDGKIAIESKAWDDLTEAQQSAACTMGYTQRKWDDESDSSSSLSSSDDSEPRKKQEKEDVYTEQNTYGICPNDISSFADMGSSICRSANSTESSDGPPVPDSVITESDIALLSQRHSEIGSTGSLHKRSRVSVTKYGKYRFNKLPSNIQQAALVLGFTRSTWDRNLFIPRKSKTWDTLTPAEIEAAKALGCSEEKWKKLLDSW